jgi:hypothetical protein
VEITPPPSVPVDFLKPPPGGKRIKKIFVTDDGKLKVEYEDIPE